MNAPSTWTTKEDLEKLIGQAESLRLEFKGSKIFDESKQPDKLRNEVSANLSCEVSAFANTEGGILVIGIQEKKDGKARYADKLDDGVDHKKYYPEWLQQIIESNISPYLPGIRVRPVFLDPQKTRCAYIIEVPKGSTAYQASDKKYYGRSEYASNPLPDHEVRLRMFRGRYPSAEICIDNCMKQICNENKHKTTTDRTNHQNLHVSKINTDKVSKYKFSFCIFLQNVGEINIDEFKVQIEYKYSKDLNLDLDVSKETKTFKDGRVASLSLSLLKYADCLPTPEVVNIYPGDGFFIEKKEFFSQDENLPNEFPLIMRWQLHLKDTQPINGEINLIQKFQEIAQLAPESDPTQPRVPGQDKGRIFIAPDCDEPLPEETL